MADEPTGNLIPDQPRGDGAARCGLNEERGVTVVMVTHEADVAAYAAREIVFRDGLVSADTPNRSRRRPA